MIDLPSPYTVDWNFGPLPDGKQQPVGTMLAVLVPDTYIGFVKRVDGDDGHWRGYGMGIEAACSGAWWTFKFDDGEWTGWEEANVWWTWLV